MAYQSRREAQEQSLDQFFPDRTIDLHLPLALIMGATVIEFVAAGIRGSKSSLGVQSELITLAARMVLGPVTMLLGVFITAKFRGIELGRLPTAILKLAAVAIAPGAIVTFASPALALIPLGFLIGLAGHFILYFALLGTLFKMDESDTWYCVCVIFLIDLSLYFALLAWRG